LQHVKQLGFWVCLLGLLMSLTACDQVDSDFLYKHPRLLNYVLQHCEAARYSQSTYCQTAAKQARQLQSYSMAFLSNQVEFGKAILTTEMQLAHTTDAKVKQDLTKQRDQMLFIVGWYASPV